MERDIPAILNSPIIQKHTPIRLGLSRKRKSCGSEGSLNTKIQKINLEKENEMNVTDENIKDGEIVDYEKEMETLNSRIKEKEEKLKALQCSKDKIQHLEKLIELWKNGCKNAFLQFSQLLKERELEVNIKPILNNLGVWETLVENFENDSEICLSDYSQ